MSETPDNNRRRFLAFSLRGVFVTLTGFGGCLAWLERQRRVIRERRAIAEELELSDSGGALPSAEIADAAIAFADPSTLAMPRSPFPVSFVRRLMADESAYCVILWNEQVSEVCARKIAEAFPEAIIWRLNRNDPRP
jgi:hypothetical protein